MVQFLCFTGHYHILGNKQRKIQNCTMDKIEPQHLQYSLTLLLSHVSVTLPQLWRHIHQRTLDQIWDHSSTTEGDFDAGLLEARLSSLRHFEAQLLETDNDNNKTFI